MLSAASKPFASAEGTPFASAASKPMGSLLEGVISFYVNRKLKELLADFSSSNLDVQLRGGRLQLQDLALQPGATEGWGLPCAIRSATIGKLEVLMPWSSGSDDGPLIVRLDGLCVVLQPRHAAPLNAERQRHWQQRFKQRRLPPVGEAASGAQGAAAVPLDASQHQALVDALLRNLHVSVTDLRVRYEVPGGPAVQLVIPSLQLRCHRQQSLPSLLACFVRRSESQMHRCLWQLDALVSVSYSASAGSSSCDHPAASAAGESKEDEEAILRPLTVCANVATTLHWPPAAEAHTQPLAIEVDGGLHVGELQFELGVAQLQFLVLAAHRATHAAVFERHRALRPVAGPRAMPREWWAFASAAVRCDIAAERSRCSWRGLRERARLRGEYEAALLAASGVDGAGRADSSSSRRSRAVAIEAVHRLEEQLELPELLDLRRRVDCRISSLHRSGRASPTGRPSLAALSPQGPVVGRDPPLPSLRSTTPRGDDGAGQSLGDGSRLRLDVSLRITAVAISAAVGLLDGEALSCALSGLTVDVKHSLVLRGLGQLSHSTEASAGARALEVNRHAAGAVLPPCCVLAGISARRDGGRAGSGSHTRGRVATSSAAAPFLQVTAHLDAPEDTPPRGGAAACVGCPLTLVLELGLAQQILLLGRCIVLPGPHSFSALPIGAIEAAEAAAAVGTLGRPPLAQAERASDGEAATVVAGAQLSLQLDMPQPLVVVLTAAELPLSRLDARPPPPVIAEASQLSVPVLRMPRLHLHLSGAMPTFAGARNDDSHNDTASALRLWVHVGIGLAFTSERALMQALGARDPPLPARRMTLGSDVTPVAPPRSRTASASSSSGALQRRETEGAELVEVSIDLEDSALLDEPSAVPHILGSVAPPHDAPLHSNERLQSPVRALSLLSAAECATPPSGRRLPSQASLVGGGTTSPPARMRGASLTLELLSSTLDLAARLVSDEHSAAPSVVEVHDRLHAASIPLLEPFELPFDIEIPASALRAAAAGGRALAAVDVARLVGALPALRVHIWSYALVQLAKLADVVSSLGAAPIRDSSGAPTVARPQSAPPAAATVHCYPEAAGHTPALSVGSLPSRPPSVDARVELASIVLCVHAAQPSTVAVGEASRADLLTVHMDAMQLHAEVAADSARLQASVASVEVRDARPFVALERASIVQLRAAAAPPLSQGLRLRLCPLHTSPPPLEPVSMPAPLSPVTSVPPPTRGTPTPPPSVESTSKVFISAQGEVFAEAPSAGALSAVPMSTGPPDFFAGHDGDYGAVEGSSDPLLSGEVTKSEGVIDVRLRLACDSVGLQWNPSLVDALVDFGIGLLPSLAAAAGLAAPAASAARAASAAAVPAAEAPQLLSMSLDGTVGAVELRLNVEDEPGASAGLSPLPLAPPSLVCVTAGTVGVALHLSPAGDIHLDLSALLREVRSPTSSGTYAPARSTFAMVTPIPAVAGGAPPTSVSAAVHLLQPASGALDVTVDVEPIAFELRNDVLMQTIDFIDRCIKRPLSRMKAAIRPGAHGSKMPRWRVRVPAALVRIPTAGEGAVETLCDEASVGNAPLLQPILTDLIVVKAKNVRAFAARPVAADDMGVSGGSKQLVRSLLPMMEKTAEISLELRKPLQKGEAAALGQPLLELAISSTLHTLHVGLQPNDLRLLIAVWLDNFSRSYRPPPDPTKPVQARSCIGLAVSVRAAQLALWLHATAAAPPFLRILLHDTAVDVKKRVDGVSDIGISVMAVSVHADADGGASGPPQVWQQLLAPPIASCAAAARAMQAADGGSLNLQRSPVATSKTVDGSAVRNVAAGGSTNPVSVHIVTGGEQAEEISVDAGSQCISLLPTASLALAQFGLAAGPSCFALLKERKRSATASKTYLGQRVSIHASLVQLALPQSLPQHSAADLPAQSTAASNDGVGRAVARVAVPSASAPRRATTAASLMWSGSGGATQRRTPSQGLGEDEANAAIASAGADPATAGDCSPDAKLLVMHFDATIELSKSPPTAQSLASLSAAPSAAAASGVGVEQLVLQLRHSYSCLSHGGLHEAPPAAHALLTPSDYRLRATGVSFDVTVIPGAADEQPSFLESFALDLNVTKRAATPSQPASQQVSAVLYQAFRLSASLPLVTLAHAAVAHWVAAMQRVSLDALQPVSASWMADTRSTSSADGTLTVLFTVPFVQLTLLSQEVRALPLLQIRVGEVEGSQAVTLTMERHGASMPLAVEAVVPVRIDWYHAALFVWEPLVESFAVVLTARAGELSTVNLAVPTTVNVNVSDKMLLALHDNLVAVLAAIAPAPAPSASLLAAAEARRRAGGDCVATANAPVGIEALAAAAATEEEAAANAGCIPYTLLNLTGEPLAYWADDGTRDAAPMSSQLGSSSTRSTGRTYCGDSEGRSCSGVVSTQRASTGGVARGPPSLVLQPGESALLRFWDGDVSRQRDWQEDAPRAITIQPISRQRGWRPVNGVVVNQPGTSVLRLERAAGPPAGLLQPFARSVVCDVELHDRGTRLTLRSMATVVNQTQRTLAVDLELPHTPMKHLGVLAAGEQLAVAESHLDGGLRITDCGVGASAAQVQVALNEVDEAIAMGRARPVVWLGPFLCTEENRASAEEEAAWRGAFAVPGHEFLVRALSCSLVEKKELAGELFVGSHSLHFKSRVKLPDQFGGKEREARLLTVAYTRIVSFAKRAGKLPANKGFVVHYIAADGGVAASSGASGMAQPEPRTMTLINFGAANESRHLLERLVMQHANIASGFARELGDENEKFRAKFNLQAEASECVLHEYACALIHADGSSKGKLYVSQHYLCFAGKLFGKDTRAVYAAAEIVAVEASESPAPNSITVTSTSTEERFTFLQGRTHALQTITQLLALTKGEHSLAAPRELPTDTLELPAERFLDRVSQPATPHVLLPLELHTGTQLAASCWRYPVRTPWSTGAPFTMLLQAPVALHNLLPYPLEWRLVTSGAQETLAHEELAPEAVHDFHSLAPGSKYGLQLRLPGYAWSSPVDLSPTTTSDRLEMVRLRPFVSSTKALRVLLQHRSSCARTRHVLQAYVTHWLVNSSGLTLQFKQGKKLTLDESIAKGSEAATADQSRLFEAEDARLISDGASSYASTSTLDADEGEELASDAQTLMYSVARGSKNLLAVRVAAEHMKSLGALATLAEDAATPSAAASAASRLLPSKLVPGGVAIVAGDGSDGGSGGGGGGEGEESASGGAGRRRGNWSPPFSLHTGPTLGVTLRSFRAGPYDLAVSIAPLVSEGALPTGAGASASGRTKVVTFVQRFWLHNRLGIALECEQCAPAGGRRLSQPGVPLASGERSPFHWPHPREETLLRVRPVPGQTGYVPGNADEGWSGGFPIDSVGYFAVHCEQGVAPDDGDSQTPAAESAWWRSLLRVMVEVKLEGACLQVTFDAAPPAPPPIKIVNTTSYVCTCAQRGAERRRHRVVPKCEAAYAWAESSLDHSLLVSVAWIQTEVTVPRVRLDLLRGGDGNGRDDTGGDDGSHGDSSEQARSEGAGIVRSVTEHVLVEKQPLALDSLMRPVPLAPQSAGSSSKGAAPIAWAMVTLEEGVRVLTISDAPVAPLSAAVAEEPHTFLGLSLGGVGVSLVHAGVGEELVYLSLTQLTADIVLSQRSATVELLLFSFQIDHQQATATLPAVLSLADAQRRAEQPADAQPPAVHLSISKQLRKAGGAVDWWDLVSFRLLELDVALEPPFIQSLLDLTVAAGLPKLVRMLDRAKPQKGGRPVRQREVELLRYGAPQRMWYFQRLELHPVKVNLTFRHNNNWGELGALPIPNIDAAPICLAALHRDTLFGTADDLAASIGDHYKFAALRQLHRVVLQVDMLGDPIGLVRSLGVGVKDLFYLPAKAVVRSPRRLGQAMVEGGASFAKNAMLAPINTTGKMTKAALRGTDRALAALAMSSASTPVASAQTGGRLLLQGTAGLGKGVLFGVTGLVLDPIKGARTDGVRGFTLGVGKGIVGAGIRPIAGVLQFADSAAGAMQTLGGEGEERATHSARVGRVRPPRMLHGTARVSLGHAAQITAYSLAEALAKHVLQSAEDGKYLLEPLLHCDVLQQEGQTDALVVVLTGQRLIIVETSGWRVQLNVVLRKVHAVQRTGSAVMLQVAKKASTPTTEARRIMCFSEEAAAALHDTVHDAVVAARGAARRVWQAAPPRATGGAAGGGPGSSASTRSHRRSLSDGAASRPRLHLG